MRQTMYSKNMQKHFLGWKNNFSRLFLEVLGLLLACLFCRTLKTGWSLGPMDSTEVLILQMELRSTGLGKGQG